jgi:hypothetical protein
MLEKSKRNRNKWINKRRKKERERKKRRRNTEKGRKTKKEKETNMRRYNIFLCFLLCLTALLGNNISVTAWNLPCYYGTHAMR